MDKVAFCGKDSKMRANLDLFCFCRHQANLGLDAEFLLRGVSELDLVTGGIPSILLVHGVLSFPLCLDSSHCCLLAAARYGQGRVVVATHESQLFSPKLARFVLNAVRWLDAGRKGLVGVDASLKKLCSLLSQGEVKSQVSQLTGDISVYCCSSYSDREAEKLHAFVAEGGGLLVGGQAWYWASQNHGKAAVANYPGNKILNRFGLSILGQSGQAAKHPAVGSGEHYHFRKALALFNSHVDKHEELQAPLKDWLQRLAQDCAAFLHIPAHDCPAYASLHRILTKVLQRSGIPHVSRHCPVKSNSKEAVLLCMATELSLTMTDSAALVQKSAAGVCALPITVEIDGTNPGEECISLPLDASCCWDQWGTHPQCARSCICLNMRTDVQFHCGLVRRLTSVSWQTGSFCCQPRFLFSDTPCASPASSLFVHRHSREKNHLTESSQGTCTAQRLGRESLLEKIQALHCRLFSP